MAPGPARSRPGARAARAGRRLGADEERGAAAVRARLGAHHRARAGAGRRQLLSRRPAVVPAVAGRVRAAGKPAGRRRRTDAGGRAPQQGRRAVSARAADRGRGRRRRQGADHHAQLAPDDAAVHRGAAHRDPAADRVRPRARDRRAAQAVAGDEHAGRARRADLQPAARPAARQGQDRRRRTVPPAAAALHGRARHPRRRARRPRPHPPEPGPAGLRAGPGRAGAGSRIRRRCRRCCWRST